MSLPPLLSAFVTEWGIPPELQEAGYATVTEHECEGSRFHSPAPLLVRHVTLPNGERAWLCSTCADNLVMYRWIIKTHTGNPPWPLRREFGNGTRLLAQRGGDMTHG